MKSCTLIASGTAAAILGGCAADTTKVQSQYVSPKTYASYDCRQIGEEFGRLSRRAEEVGAVVDKMAADDQAQAFVGLVIFWPALFLLEGGDTQQMQEYARLKGQMEALETVSVQKGCGTDIRQVAQYGTSSAQADKLDSLKTLYMDGAITKDEYLRRRSEIGEAAARDELRALDEKKAGAASGGSSTASNVSVSAPARNDSSLKVAVLPFATTRGAGATRQELNHFSRNMVTSEPELSLTAIYPPVDEDEIWSKSFTDGRPKPDRVFDYLAEIDADIGLTYFYSPRSTGWGTSDLFFVDIYVFDRATTRLHQRKADDTNYKEVIRQMLRAVAQDHGKTLRY